MPTVDKERFIGLFQRSGLKQSELASAAGVSRSYVSEVVRGPKSPSLKLAETLARLTNSEVNALLTVAARMARREPGRGVEHALHGWESGERQEVLGELAQAASKVLLEARARQIGLTPDQLRALDQSIEDVFGRMDGGATAKFHRLLAQLEAWLQAAPPVPSVKARRRNGTLDDLPNIQVEDRSTYLVLRRVAEVLVHADDSQVTRMRTLLREIEMELWGPSGRRGEPPLRRS